MPHALLPVCRCLELGGLGYDANKKRPYGIDKCASCASLPDEARRKACVTILAEQCPDPMQDCGVCFDDLEECMACVVAGGPLGDKPHNNIGNKFRQCASCFGPYTEIGEPRDCIACINKPGRGWAARWGCANCNEFVTDLESRASCLRCIDSVEEAQDSNDTDAVERSVSLSDLCADCNRKTLRAAGLEQRCMECASMAQSPTDCAEIPALKKGKAHMRSRGVLTTRRGCLRHTRSWLTTILHASPRCRRAGG